jgi:hypothetical protein
MKVLTVVKDATWHMATLVRKGRCAHLKIRSGSVLLMKIVADIGEHWLIVISAHPSAMQPAEIKFYPG